MLECLPVTPPGSVDPRMPITQVQFHMAVHMWLLQRWFSVSCMLLRMYTL